ncbi:RDD family protein [Bacillus solimangrovi]|uniref:RDD family protein n=1 Tax=Bacillus solimangrovi TaxID=1305675 RepID=UPI00158698F0|nr:RDD family protein [Bacillus solimangrovi]
MKQRPADYFFRFFAATIDTVFILSIITLPLWLVFSKSDSFYILNFILTNLYLIALPVIWNGFLIGKRLTGMRIVKLNGEKVSVKTMIVRQLGGGFIYLISFGILSFVSCFMVIMRQDRRAIHDFLAGTIVIEDKN